MVQKFTGLTGRERAIFRYVHRHGPVTKSVLTNSLGLKLSTLNRATDVLEERGLLSASGWSDSSGGRRPQAYDVAHGGVYFIGADISRTYVQTVLVNLKMEVLAQERWPVDAGTTPQSCAAAIADAAARMCAAGDIAYEELLGVGIGTVGPMDRAQGILLNPQGFPNPQWAQRVPLSQMVSEASGLPCFVDNGANAAALLEYTFGAGRGCNSLAYIQCGVGLRSAVVREGKILRTMNDRADVFAYMVVDPEGRRLEEYASLRAACARCAQKTGRAVPYGELLQRASEGNDCAAGELLRSAGMLGMAAANLAALLDPDLVILSGPLVTGFEPYFDRCAEAFRRMTDGITRAALLRGGGAREAAVAAGSALLFLDRCLAEDSAGPAGSALKLAAAPAGKSSNIPYGMGLEESGL